MAITLSNENAKTVQVMDGNNPRSLYEHQINAIRQLNTINKKPMFNALVVLPTGAGKTMTAVSWLLSVALDKGKKVLWLAHRHLLLEQAADSFTYNAYSDKMLNCRSFKYRIISGNHDKPVHIQPDDDILIMSKDSLVRNPTALNQWLEDEDEIYFVIDEAHHATAKSYRKIIEHVRSLDLYVKLLGLTATPFRTSEQEQGLLGKIFTDDIIYQTDLKSLITKGILSTPIFEEYQTASLLGDLLGQSAIQRIVHSDIIPENLQNEIADNAHRNRFIVKQFFKDDNPNRYGKTLVFSLNKIHAFTLKKLFEKEAEKRGLRLGVGVIVSGTSAEFIGIDVSNEENQRQIEAFRLPPDDPRSIQVLINVNILTEGADLPQTQTVFLTRPTISTVLMTQMVGRALRGQNAGGTKDAYIVSFVDNWNDKIAWVNPATIVSAEEKAFSDNETDRVKAEVRLISIAKIEEFARVVDDTVDTTRLENIDYSERIPLGMYMFSYMDTPGNDNAVEYNHQILVYNNCREYYAQLIAALPSIFNEYNIDQEVIAPEQLNEMVQSCELAYFDSDMIPPYDRRDIEALFQFYVQKESEPLFVSFSENNRNKVDLNRIAKDIIDRKLPPDQESELINQLWEDESSLIKAYYSNKFFFAKQLMHEKLKLYGMMPAMGQSVVNAISEQVDIARFPLATICEQYPVQGRILKEGVYSQAKTIDGMYVCAICGKTSPHKGLFQIDHIQPMAKGGLTINENLQLLCRSCNMKKSDRG